MTGRLGQRHADVLEAILFHAERRRNTDDGGIEVLVDPDRIRRCMSSGHRRDRDQDDNRKRGAARYSYSRIIEFVRELRAAVVDLESTTLVGCAEPLTGGLIDHREPSPMVRRDPLTGEERHLWRVRLGKPLALLIRHDLLPLHYNPAPLARLQHGISQAVARHVLTHKTEPTGGWTLDGLIKAVGGGGTSDGEMRKARMWVRKDAAALSELGIDLAMDRVRRRVPQGPGNDGE